MTRLFLLSTALMLLMVSCGGQGQRVDSSSNESTYVVTQTETQNRDGIFETFPCAENGPEQFTSAFFPTDLITTILPMGKVSGQSGHVTPTDHLYVHRSVPIGEDNDYVLAPADGAIVKIERFGSDKLLDFGDTSSPMVPDYRLILMHSCSLFTIFIHLGELAPDIVKKTGDIPLNKTWSSRESVPIEIGAGDPIAKFGQLSLDWSVHDAESTLTGFVVPEHYTWEPWKIHTVDPFQFYDEPFKSALLSKVVREVAPRAGKIDYDVEGTIAGNWFREGTVDYFGGRSGKTGYWEGHLSIAYSYIDPSQVRIAIGFDTGINEGAYCPSCRGSYGIRANLPDPINVTPETGLVKYELMSRKNAGGSDYVTKEQLGTTSLGTFLVQHLGDRTIRVEVVAGKSPDEVPDFSDASVIYRR